MRLEQPTLKLLEDYKEKVLNQLHESRRKTFDFDKPVFLVAAFFVQALRMKIAVDKTKLLSAAAVSDRQFLRVKQSMIEICFPSILEKAIEKKERLKKLNVGRKNVPKGVIVKMKEKETDVPNDNNTENEPSSDNS